MHGGKFQIAAAQGSRAFEGTIKQPGARIEEAAEPTICRA